MVQSYIKPPPRQIKRRAGDNLVLSKEDIDNFCKICGTCCTNLYFVDKLEIFLSSGRFVGFGETCKYYRDDEVGVFGHCNIENKKPKICVKWKKCGVVEKLKYLLEQK